MQARSKYKYRTQAEFEYVLNNWKSKTIFEIANDLNLVSSAVSSMATTLRKNGFELPKKTSPQTQKQILIELAKKYKS